MQGIFFLLLTISDQIVLITGVLREGRTLGNSVNLVLWNRSQYMERFYIGTCFNGVPCRNSCQ